MKILLIKPSSYDREDKLRKYKKGYMPFITLALLKALTPKDIDVRVVDETIEEVNVNEQVDLVGITTLTFNVKRAYEIADRFRAKGVTVVMGGHHVSALPEEALIHADTVVIGEAENTWQELLEDFKDKKIKKIYRAKDLADLSKLPIPDFSTFDFSRYLRPFFSSGPFFPIQATRGCPFDCDFCSVTSFFGRTFRFKPVSLVLEEIKRCRTGYYFFVDDNIIGNVAYAKELFKALIPLKIKWLGQFSANIANYPDLITVAGKSGCLAAYIGFESLTEINLSEINKKTNKIEQYPALFKMLNKVNIRPFASIIFGFDNDTTEIFDKTLNFLFTNKAGKAYFYILTPIPGTKLYERLDAEKRITTKNWDLYDGANVVFKPLLLSPEQLETGLWKTYQRFFTLPKILTRNLFYSLRNPIMYPLLLFFDMHFRKMVYQRKQPLNESAN